MPISTSTIAPHWSGVIFSFSTSVAKNSVTIGYAPEMVVISDAPHLPRALWILRRYGVAAVGSAPEPPPSCRLWPLRLREACAFPLSMWKVARRTRP